MDARTFFENELQVLDYKKSFAALKLGCNPGTITHYMNGKELKFDTALKTTFLFDGNETFLKMYCSESAKIENIKPSLEFLSTNRYFNELRQVIFRCDSLNILNDWTDTYKIVLSFQQRSKSFEEILSEIYEAQERVKDKEMKILLKVLEANIYHNLFESTSFSRIIKTVEILISKLDDGYFKNSLTMRVIELKSQESLFVLFDLDSARDYAKTIISSKIGTKFVADAYNILGTSYLFENCKKSLKYMDKSIKILRGINCNNVADKYEFGNRRFIQTYWSENLFAETSKTETAEVAFMMAKRGESKQALELLNGMDITPFRMYYRAIAENNPMLHFQAMNEFSKRNLKFYAQLPYKELLKDENYREIAQNLMK